MIKSLDPRGRERIGEQCRRYRPLDVRADQPEQYPALGHHVLQPCGMYTTPALSGGRDRGEQRARRHPEARSMVRLAQKRY